jgi:hypothetical protein
MSFFFNLYVNEGKSIYKDDDDLDPNWIPFTECWPQYGDLIYLISKAGIYSYDYDKPNNPIKVLVKYDERYSDNRLEYVWLNDHSTRVHLKGFTHWRRTE